MPQLILPPEVESVLLKYYTCEFTTFGKNGSPVSWPTMPLYWRSCGKFIISSPVGLSQKAANIRRNPKVSLLFSNATGSGIDNGPAVLIQGDAEAPDRIFLSPKEQDLEILSLFREQLLQLLKIQPGFRIYLKNRFTRYLMDWYFMRVMITVTPRRIYWWEKSNFLLQPYLLELQELDYVERY